MKNAREAYDEAVNGNLDKRMDEVPGIHDEVDEISRAVLAELPHPVSPGTPAHVMIKNALALAVKMGLALGSPHYTSTRRR